MKNILIQSIVLYQKTISPDHGWFAFRYPYGFCRHYPSCSEYTKLSIEKYGSTCGIMRGILRILRCNPLTRPKIERV